MQNSCIYIKIFDDTHTIYSASKPVEIYMGSDTNDATDSLFNTLLQRNSHITKNGSEFIPGSVELLYYYFQK